VLINRQVPQAVENIVKTGQSELLNRGVRASLPPCPTIMGGFTGRRFPRDSLLRTQLPSASTVIAYAP
jgi:hypothetical protein